MMQLFLGQASLVQSNVEFLEVKGFKSIRSITSCVANSPKRQESLRVTTSNGSTTPHGGVENDTKADPDHWFRKDPYQASTDTIY